MDRTTICDYLRIAGWMEQDGLTLIKADIKLGRMEVAVSYSALYRFVRDEFSFRGPKVTVRKAVTESGEVAQVYFGQRDGLRYRDNRQRVLHTLVATLVPCNT